MTVWPLANSWMPRCLAATFRINCRLQVFPETNRRLKIFWPACAQIKHRQNKYARKDIVTKDKSNSRQPKMPKGWQEETKALRAVQMAFDLEADLQKGDSTGSPGDGSHPIRSYSPAVRVNVRERPRRLRLSVSLTMKILLSWLTCTTSTVMTEYPSSTRPPSS